MREILFRGKRVDNGEWIYGDLRHWPSGNVGIHSEELHHTYYVDSESVGQFTGQHDKNGQKIFEGDIVFVPRLGKSYEVKFMFGQFFVGINGPIAYERHTCEVIGNIHDNPELLREDEQ